MAYDFRKLAEAEALTEVPEGTSVLAEVGGAIKRIPGGGLGGSGGAGGYVMKPALEELTPISASGTLVLEISTNYDDLLKTLEKGGSGSVAIPYALLSPSAPETMFLYVSIMGWMYTSEEDYAAGYGEVAGLVVFGSIMGELPVIMQFTNGTYVPNL